MGEATKQRLGQKNQMNIDSIVNNQILFDLPIMILSDNATKINAEKFKKQLPFSIKQMNFK